MIPLHGSKPSKLDDAFHLVDGAVLVFLTFWLVITAISLILHG